MKKLIAAILALTLILSLGAFALADDKEESPDAEFVIRLGHVRTADTPCHIALQGAADRIFERTNGAVQILVYPNGELAAYGDGIEAVRSDAAYIFYSSPGQFSDYVPDFVALQCPYLYDTFEQYEALMDSDVIKTLTDQAEEEGIHTINLAFLTGFRYILTDHPVTTVDDVKGLKIRLPNNRVWTEPFELMGANITCLDWGESYTALQQGIVDAVEGDPTLFVDAKMYELKKVCSETNHLLDLSGLFIGSGYWDTIPEEYQQIITEEFAAAADENNRGYEEKIEIARQQLIDEGVEFYPVEIDGFKEKTESLVLKYSVGEELLKELAAIK